jgi:hypothetical protein
MPTQAKDGERIHVRPDKIIEDIGGCGRFQVRMAIVVHLIKTIICFTVTGMIFISKTPAWWCEDEIIERNMTSCIADVDVNGTSFDFCPKKACNINGAACSRVNFDRSLTTVATEVKWYSFSQTMSFNNYYNTYMFKKIIVKLSAPQNNAS